MLPVPWPTQGGADDQRSRAAGRSPSSGDHRCSRRRSGKRARSRRRCRAADRRCFGLFRSRAAAARVVKPLSKGGDRAMLTRTLTRAEYERRGPPRCQDGRENRLHLTFCGQPAGRALRLRFA